MSRDSSAPKAPTHSAKDTNPPLLLRGDYNQADYGKVILPLTVIRRLDCVLDRTKAKVLAKHDELKKAKHPEGTVEKMLLRASGTSFYDTSKLDFEKLKGDRNHIGATLRSYIKGFSPNARDTVEQFKFADQALPERSGAPVSSGHGDRETHLRRNSTRQLAAFT